MQLKDNIYKMKRNSEGVFGSTCGSKFHGKSQPHTYLTSLMKRKRLSKANYDILLSSNLLKSEAKNICQPCIDEILQRTTTPTTDKTKDVDDKIENEDTHQEYLNYLQEKAMQLGNELYPFLKSDISELKKKENKVENIKGILSHDPKKWCDKRPSSLINLLYSLCGIQMSSATDNQNILISKAVENIYSCISSKVVLPNHFVENLLCYSLTNCKSYLNFLANRTPGGGYSYISNWLRNQSKEPISFPIGLVKTVFDNSQKIGKTYLISSTNKVPSTVITSQLWITFDEDDNCQSLKELSPKEWIATELSADQQNSLIDHISKPTDQFRITRNKHIQ